MGTIQIKKVERTVTTGKTGEDDGTANAPSGSLTPSPSPTGEGSGNNGGGSLTPNPSPTGEGSGNSGGGNGDGGDDSPNEN